MRTIEYLDAAKSRLGIESDYALAKALKVSHSSISGYRAGKSRIDDDVALKLADILEINPLVPIAAANIERAKTDEIRQRWLALMEKISKDFKDLMSRANPRRRTLPTW